MSGDGATRRTIGMPQMTKTDRGQTCPRRRRHRLQLPLVKENLLEMMDGVAGHMMTGVAGTTAAGPDGATMPGGDDRGGQWTSSSTGTSTTTPTARPSGTATARTTSSTTTMAARVNDGSNGNAGTSRGPSEKLLIPTFSGEAGETGELGNTARSYLRQVTAWERMTKLSADQRALVLYQNLQGAAWVNAESLDVDLLARGDGVRYLKEWVTHSYLDVEVTQVGRSLSDLFRKLKRRTSQTFRDYAAEFNRLLSRVTECGCTLPDVATAWLFVDRANLDETTEVSLPKGSE